MKRLNAWKADRSKEHSLLSTTQDSLHARLLRAEAEVRYLKRCVELRDRQLGELRMALAHSATIHYSVEDRLQRELDALRITTATDELNTQFHRCSSEWTEHACVVTLPYVTSTLSVLFDAMRTFWAHCDRERPPKSMTVARDR